MDLNSECGICARDEVLPLPEDDAGETFLQGLLGWIIQKNVQIKIILEGVFD